MTNPIRKRINRNLVLFNGATEEEEIVKHKRNFK